MITDNQKLHFSIIIPTFQRPSRRLNACLQALCDLDYPVNCFEVILIDDGSPVSPDEIVLKFQDSLAITLYEESHIGPANLRNLGATYARGSYLAFTDDDCQPIKNWLQIAARHFETHPNHAIGGKSLLALRDNIFSSASHVLVDYLYKFYNNDPDKARFLDSNNMIVKKDLFQAVEGFTTKFSLGGAGADREFSDRWIKSGYTAQFIPELCVYHCHELSFKSFWRQQFNYGRAAFYYRRSKYNSNNRSIKLEKLSFYLCLLYHPFKVDKGIRAIVLHLLVIMSQLAICFGYVSEKMKSLQRENSPDITEKEYKMEGKCVRFLRQSGSFSKTILREIVQLGKRAMYLTGVVSRPFRVQMDVTDRCNFKCPTCIKWTQPPSKDELDINGWTQVFNKVSKVPLLREVTICGGEPFSRPDIMGILKLAKSNNLYTVVVTNGWYLDDTIIKQIDRVGVDRVIVSLNSLNETIHDNSRGIAGSHQRIMNLIRLWQESDLQFDLCLESIIMAGNVHELSELANYVQENKLNGIIYQVLAPSDAHYPFANGVTMHRHRENWFKKNPRWVNDHDILRHEVKTLLQLQKIGLPIINPPSQIKKFPLYYENPAAIRNNSCLGLLATLYIDPFGQLRLCYGFPPIGNILQDDPLHVWYSQPAKELRKKAKQCRRLCRLLNNNL